MEKHNSLSTLAYKLARHIPLAGKVSLSLAVAFSSLIAWAGDGFLHNIRFDQSSRHFVIDTTGPVKAVVNTLTIAGRKRVIIDLDNADIGGDLPRDSQLLQDLSAQLPDVRNVTVNQYGGNGRPIVRVLLDLQGDPGAIRLLRNQGPHIELEIRDYAAATTPTTYPPTGNSNYSNDTPYSTQNRGMSTYSGSSLPSLNQTSHDQTGSLANHGSSTQTGANSTANMVSRDQYNQSLRTQQELKQQVESLRQQLASQASGPQLEQMKRTLVVMNDRYSQLEQENNSLKSKLVSSQSASASNATELSRLHNQLTQLTTKNAELQNRLLLLNSNNRSSAALAETKQKLADLSNQYDLLKQDKLLQGQQVQQLTQDKMALNGQIAQLKSQLASKGSSPNQASVSDSELKDLRQKLSTAQQAMNDSLKTIQEQNQEMAYLRNQVNSVKSGMDAAAKEQISSLQSSNEQKDKTIAELRQQLSTATNHQSSNSTTETLRQRDARITELEKALYQAKQQALTAQATQKQLDEAKAQIAQLKANDEQRQNAERELGNAKTQLSQLQIVQKQLANAQQQLEASQIDLRVTKSQLSQLQSDESQLKAARQDLTVLKAEIERIKAQGNSASTSSQAQKEAIAKLTQDNLQLGKQLAQVTAQLKTAQEHLADKTVDNNAPKITQLQSQISDLNRELQQANTQLRAAQSRTQTASTTSSGKSNTASTAQLQKQVGDLSQELNSLRRENNDLKDSLASKQSGLSGNNSDAEASYQEAKIAQKARKTTDALDKYKAALLLDPNNSRYTIDYSIALSEDQQYAEAIDVLRRYLQHNPGDRDAYNQLGKIYLLNDQADAANQSFMRAIPVSTLNNYATSLKKLGKLGEAEAMFKLALSINPKDSEVLFNLGNLYNNQNKLEQARNKYLEAIQIRPDFAEAHYNLGLIFAKMGDNPKAITHLEKFLQLSPNARNAETIRAYVQKLRA